jgi:hypothetical protein
MPYYIVWMCNKTDNRDDEPIKVKASSKEAAGEAAAAWPQAYRFNVGEVYTLKEFKKYDAWWHSCFWGKKAVNE